MHSASSKHRAMIALFAAPTLLASTALGQGGAQPAAPPAAKPGGSTGSAPAATVSTAPRSAAALAVELAPTVAETRVFRVLQTVELAEVPNGAKRVRMWAAVPADGPWQRVLERRVVDAPAGWQLVRQTASGGDMIFVDAPAGTGPMKVVVESIVRRESPVVDVGAPTPAAMLQTPFQAQLFTDALRTDATNMAVDDKVRALARAACGDERDPRRKVVKLLQATADAADHYSKDPSKPHCGRGSAQDCMENGGGCCTDLHSLFIAMARAEGIPARLQMGYRLKPEQEGKSYDPSYRCWVEYWLDGSGWVPTDIVVADGGDSAARAAHWGRLDAKRVWLWEGRGFDLLPKQAAPPIQTMHSGWVEIDGKPVDVLPAADGTPSKLRRTIVFEDLTDEFAAARP